MDRNELEYDSNDLQLGILHITSGPFQSVSAYFGPVS